MFRIMWIYSVTKIYSWGQIILLNLSGWLTHSLELNIARGTTDPGYWFWNLSYISCKKINIQSKGKFNLKSGATCISCKFGHQVTPLEFQHCLGLRSSVGIELLSSSTRVTSVKSAKGLLLRETWTHRSDQGYLGPIKIQANQMFCLKFEKSGRLAPRMPWRGGGARGGAAPAEVAMLTRIFIIKQDLQSRKWEFDSCGLLWEKWIDSCPWQIKRLATVSFSFNCSRNFSLSNAASTLEKDFLECFWRLQFYIEYLQNANILVVHWTIYKIDKYLHRWRYIALQCTAIRGFDCTGSY